MHAPRRDLDAVRERVYRSRFFVYALFLHVIAFVLVAMFFVIPDVEEASVPSVYLPVGDPDASTPRPDPAPPEQALQDPGTPQPSLTAEPSLPGPTSPTDALETILSVSGPAAGPAILPPVAPSLGPTPEIVRATPRPEDLPDRRTDLSTTLGIWRDQYDLKPNQPPSGRFPIYLARYANGDWNTGTVLREGRIVAGPLVNLATMVERASRGRLKLAVEPLPIALDDPTLLQRMPPFVYLAGHKDFQLTDAEIHNLRVYLWKGGAVWGDNGLAGRGSRFDVAFRREMKRVIPDEDKPFEPVPPGHPLYGRASRHVRAVPPGMNYFAEPVEMLRIDGSLAVLYTPNNYTDLMRMVLAEDRSVRLSIGDDAELLTPHDLWNNRDVYYRNFQPEAAEATFSFADGVLRHLLQRFLPDLGFRPQ